MPALTRTPEKRKFQSTGKISERKEDQRLRQSKSNKGEGRFQCHQIQQRIGGRETKSDLILTGGGGDGAFTVASEVKWFLGR